MIVWLRMFREIFWLWLLSIERVKNTFFLFVDAIIDTQLFTQGTTMKIFLTLTTLATLLLLAPQLVSADKNDYQKEMKKMEEEQKKHQEEINREKIKMEEEIKRERQKDELED